MKTNPFIERMVRINSNREVMKQIKKTDYLKVIGLLELAKGHYKSLVEIEKALCELLDKKYDDSGHISDAIWGENYSADQLIEKTGHELNTDELFNNQ